MPLPPLLVMMLAYPADGPADGVAGGPPPELLAKMSTPSPVLSEIVLAANRLSELPLP